MNKIKSKCPIHRIPGMQKIMQIMSDFGQKIGAIQEPNWQHHIDTLDELSVIISERIKKIDLQKLWNTTLKESSRKDGNIAKELFHILFFILQKFLLEGDLDTKMVRYMSKQYSFVYRKNLSKNELVNQIASMFAIAFADIIAVRYLEIKMNIKKNQALGMLYGNMNGGNAQLSNIISYIILGGDNNMENIFMKIKAINNSGRKNACPFYRSTIRKEWVEQMYALAEKIDFNRQ